MILDNLKNTIKFIIRDKEKELHYKMLSHVKQCQASQNLKSCSQCEDKRFCAIKKFEAKP